MYVTPFYILYILVYSVLLHVNNVSSFHRFIFALMVLCSALPFFACFRSGNLDAVSL